MDNLEYLSKKAFEIAYAVFRVTKSLKDQSLTQYLEARAVQVVDSISEGDYARVLSGTRTLQNLFRLGLEAGLIGNNTAEIIIDECGKLIAAIAEQKTKVKSLEVDLGDIFSKYPEQDHQKLLSDIGEEVTFTEEEKQHVESVPVYQNKISDSFTGLKPAISGNSAKFSFVSGEDRQTGILNAIKQTGYCRLRDLQNVYPDVSERTIRYDLEKLTNQGSIERFGNGGPATYYRLKRQV